MVFQAERTAETDKSIPTGLSKLVWYHSLFWKLTVFLVSSVVLAYIIGSAIGWLMVERDALEQWRREVKLNAQVATSSIRTIYTFITVENDDSGQITKVISERPLGDDASILDTGFNPADVLALAAAQTKNNVWMFHKSMADGRFISAADAFGATDKALLKLPDGESTDRFFAGFAEIGGMQKFIAFVPVATPSGEVRGGIVTTIGDAATLLESQNMLLKRSFGLLVTILFVTGVVVFLLMRKVFAPVPSLIRALIRIAYNDTTSEIPFLSRNDEIGRFAAAIDMVREAVMERENLRQVRDVAKEMERLAHHDTLTGLPNRALFNKKLETQIAALESGARFNVMLLDLDRFKAINDGLGHASGDALLVAFAERLSLVVGPNDMAARLGGDEFSVLQIVNRDAAAEASALAKAIIEVASQPFELMNQEAFIGASVGIASAPGQGHDISELFKNADVALYSAKTEGRGTYRFFKSGMEMARDHENLMRADLDLALQRGEFRLHYQPIFSFQQSSPVGFEALIRWKHPVSGWISPNDFIPIAEKTGQICAIGDWVIRQACKDAMTFPGGSTISVNVSAIQLQQEDFVATVQAALSDSGLPAGRLEIELTETIFVSDEGIIGVLATLRDLGVDIALDDFGTGYSSISYLMTLPITKIKIDRSFISNFEAKPESRAIVQGIILLAQGLGLKTTAEGIETQAQLAFLMEAGCHFAQGFHLGRPAAVEDVHSCYLPSSGLRSRH